MGTWASRDFPLMKLTYPSKAEPWNREVGVIRVEGLGSGV